MSLIHWWPLNGDTKDYGLNPKHGKLLGNATVGANGKLGKCLSGMSNVSSVEGIEVSNCNLVNEITGKDYSFACWFKIHGNHPQYNGTLMSSGNWNTPCDCWTVGLNQDNTAIDVFSYRHNQYLQLKEALNIDQWYHLVSVQKNNTNYVYLNGIKIGEKAATGIYCSDTPHLCIGREAYYTGWFNFNGDISDIRVYDHALSAAEIKELSKGLMVQYTFDDEVAKIRPSLLQNETGIINNTITESIVISNEKAAIGTHSCKFNGSTSIISFPVGKNDIFSNDYTLNFWVYPLDDTRAIYLGDYQTTNGNKFNFERRAGGGNFRFWHNGADVNGAGSLSELNAPINQWTMLTVTYTNKTLSFYKNGIQKKQVTNFTPAVDKSDTDLISIGRDGRTGVTALNGYLDDFRWYVTALNDQEIKELYDCGGRISNLGDALTGSFIEETANFDNLVTNIDWEQGGIADATGVATGIMNNRLRTKFIPILADTEYMYRVNSGIRIRGIHYYDKDLNWIKYQSKGANSCVDKTPENCSYIRWIIQYDNSTTNIPLDNITTYGATMSCANTNSNVLSLATKVNAQVNKNHSFTCLDICEDHNSSIQNNGRLMCRQIIEI